MLSAMEYRMTAPLRWRDLDFLGHVNQSVYHVLLEEIRSRMLSDIMVSEHGGFVLARVELDYRHEVRITDGPVDLVARISKVGTKSFHIENEIFKNDGTLAASGTAICVAWDSNQRASRAITDDERAALTP